MLRKVETPEYCRPWNPSWARYSFLAAILSLSLAACGGENLISQEKDYRDLKAASAITVTANADPAKVKHGENFDISVTVQSTRSTLIDVVVGIKKPDGSSAYSAKLTGQSISATAPIKIEDSLTVEETDPAGTYSLFVTIVHSGTSKVLLDEQDAAQIIVDDTSCTPDCAQKQCGSDGCGGSCGTCTAPQTCNSNNVCAEETTGVFDISVPLALDKTTVEIGETVQGTVTYKNNSRSAVSVQELVITSRPPNGTNADGPYMDFTPRAGTKTVQPGETVLLSASRSFTSSDPTGNYRAYATYQDAAGIWHNGTSVDFTVTSTTCEPTTCQAQNKNCGSISDGCGGTLSCGSCTAPQTCNSDNVCVAQDVCTPTTCQAQNKNCGSISDGCGGTLSCGSCTAPQTCSSENVCVGSSITCGDGVCNGSETVQSCPADCGTTPAAGTIIVDHRAVTGFDRIPSEWLEKAKALTVHLATTSHGSQIIDGLQALERRDSKYSFAFRALPSEGLPSAETPPALRVWNGTLGGTYATPDLYWESERGRADTRTAASTGHYDVSSWSWCGQQQSNSPATVQSYLDTMASFETSFPNMRFILMTGHTDGNATGTLKNNNSLVRQYANAHGKVLYDFEDIESWDPAGNYYPGTNDNCSWCADWCNAHPSECTNLPSCAHSHGYNCIIKAKAFWWMMARLAGWNGN